MPQAIIRGRGGTIETYFVDRQVASCTVSVFTGDGATKVSAAGVTIDAVATTISTPAVAEDDSLVLASASSVTAGRRYLLGTSTSTEQAEVVTIRDLDGSTATLFAPLTFDHASGAAFKGTRVSLNVTSTQADTLWWDGFADFTPSTGDVQTEVVDCVLRKIPEVLIDDSDVRDVFPKAFKILDRELDMAMAMRRARDELLTDLGGKFRALCMLGTVHLRRPCALKFWLLRRYSLGDQWAAEMDAMEKEYDRDIEQLQSQIPVDNDQDGVTTGVNDGGFTTGRLQRR